MNLIVSLTTYAKRANTVHKTIISLLNQTAEIDKIVLWLDKDEFTDNTIPAMLADLRSERFEIDYCENIRSFKKLVPAIKKYPNATIVTVDDDFEYPPTLIESLLTYHSLYPNCVIGARGRVIRVEDKEIKPYPDWQFIQLEHELKSKLAIIPIGYAGILYPPGALHKDVIKDSLFQSLCPTADDLWFKAMAMLNGTPTVIIPISRTASMHPIDGTQEDALYLSHNAGDANTKQMKAIVSHYAKLQKLFVSDSFSACVTNGYEYVKLINSIANEPKDMNLGLLSKFVNELRDAAILLEDKNIFLSKKLMELAKKGRPTGSLINKKLAEYEQKIKK